MGLFRREFLRLAGAGALIGAGASLAPGARAQAVQGLPDMGPGALFNVRTYGAKGDGKTIDTPAVNRAIDAAAAAGGGTVFFPAGTFACYTIRLKSRVVLYIEQGATILAASTPREGMTSGGYDAAEPNPWNAFQDFGHSHWRNSLIWGEGLHDVAIMGPGLISGLGLSRGHDDDKDLPLAEAPGVGNKAISLKNCNNVILRDISILKGGHFGILATGVDNFTIDNLKIDTNRDGIDIDCCRNVRVSNCTVNSPYDDGICPKSSFALGYARATENVTITNCFVTGDYDVGTLLDGTQKRLGTKKDGPVWGRTGRIKCGTESNGGFKNVVISNCTFESSRGLALMTVDGGALEDITFTGVTMRDILNNPFFLRLGSRMRGPKGTPVGTLKRVIISNVTCISTRSEYPCLLSGIPGHPIEDIKISDVYMLQPGGGTPAMAAARPTEAIDKYPEPTMIGALPASGFYVRHARNLELSHVEVALSRPDPRPIVWLDDVDGFDAHALKGPRGRAGATFQLENVRNFSVHDSRGVSNMSLPLAQSQTI